MKQYMVIYGPIGIKAEDAIPVSVIADGRTIEVTGPKDAVDYWSNILGCSVAIASTIKNNSVSFDRWASSNSMVDTLVFDDEEYNTYSDKFNAVKGITRRLPIFEIQLDKDGTYGDSDLKSFYKKVQSRMDALDAIYNASQGNKE